MKGLASLLIRRREELGLSRSAAARLIDISDDYLAVLETGLNRGTQKPSTPSPAILEKVAKGYNLPLSQLLELSGHPTPDLDENLLNESDFAFLRSWYKKASPSARKSLINLLKEMDKDSLEDN
jgi:transcriptional regulator with XRE-family HTH domain